jgi:hypothetical protein
MATTPLPLLGVHHIALICSDYAVSKAFYTEVLGLQVLREVYRAERDSYKLDLMVNGQYVLELFSFPTPRRVRAALKRRDCATWRFRWPTSRRRCSSSKLNMSSVNRFAWMSLRAGASRFLPTPMACHWSFTRCS